MRLHPFQRLDVSIDQTLDDAFVAAYVGGHHEDADERIVRAESGARGCRRAQVDEDFADATLDQARDRRLSRHSGVYHVLLGRIAPLDDSFFEPSGTQERISGRGRDPSAHVS